jgi:hypothetical protein
MIVISPWWRMTSADSVVPVPTPASPPDASGVPRRRAGSGLPIVRAWLAFAALGAGIIHLALGHASGPGIGAALAVFGLAELAWGMAVLVLDRLPLARLVPLVATAPVAAWGLWLAAAAALGGPASASILPLLPMAVTTLFDLFIAATASLVLRHCARHPEAPAPGRPRGARYLAGLVAGALAVSLLVTPVLDAAGNPPQPADAGGAVISHEHAGH